MRRRNLLTLAFTGIMAAVLLSGCGGGSSQEAMNISGGMDRMNTG